MTLRAVVIGTGWAGEGHTIALRASGVEVVAMCGRTPEPAKAMASKLGIQDVRYDWSQALAELKPDIVAIATTAAPHYEMALTAAELGCHIICDKPLGLNPTESQAMLLAVERAGIKHAYGATGHYGPAIAHIQTLLSDGLVGTVREIEAISYSYISVVPLMPYNWFHRLEQGGGLLYNGFTHALARLLRITGGQVQSVAGQARRLIERAPVGPRIHDFRDAFGPGIDPVQAERGEWCEVDADFGYTAMLKLQLPGGQIANALFQSSLCAKSLWPEHIAVYGSKGTLHLNRSDESIQFFNPESNTWTEMAIPQAILASVPQIENRVQRDWNQLFQDFVADVRGEGYGGYPTFRDGWIASEVIEIIRSGQGWQSVPKHPEISI